MTAIIDICSVGSFSLVFAGETARDMNTRYFIRPSKHPGRFHRMRIQDIRDTILSDIELSVRDAWVDMQIYVSEPVWEVNPTAPPEPPHIAMFSLVTTRSTPAEEVRIATKILRGAYSDRHLSTADLTSEKIQYGQWREERMRR